jgi:hypothetical protein
MGLSRRAYAALRRFQMCAVQKAIATAPRRELSLPKCRRSGLTSVDGCPSTALQRERLNLIEFPTPLDEYS